MSEWFGVITGGIIGGLALAIIEDTVERVKFRHNMLKYLTKEQIKNSYAPKVSKEK